MAESPLVHLHPATYRAVHDPQHDENDHEQLFRPTSFFLARSMTNPFAMSAVARVQVFNRSDV